MDCYPKYIEHSQDTQKVDFWRWLNYDSFVSWHITKIYESLDASQSLLEEVDNIQPTVQIYSISDYGELFRLHIGLNLYW
jgi:hypothetical protein